MYRDAATAGPFRALSIPAQPMTAKVTAPYLIPGIFHLMPETWLTELDRMLTGEEICPHFTVPRKHGMMTGPIRWCQLGARSLTFPFLGQEKMILQSGAHLPKSLSIQVKTILGKLSILIFYINSSRAFILICLVLNR